MDANVQRRAALIGALLVAGAAVGFVMFGSIGDNLVYFWEPQQLVEAGDDAVGATVRLGGLVKEGSVDWNQDTQELNFAVADSTGTYVVQAHAKGAPPQMFREGIGVVVEGELASNGVFECDRVMVKHSNEYRAPEEGVAAKDLYRTLDEEF
jgi:cytochrome c-type biogenesis protein CcmE